MKELEEKLIELRQLASLFQTTIPNDDSDIYRRKKIVEQIGDLNSQIHRMKMNRWREEMKHE